MIDINLIYHFRKNHRIKVRKFSRQNPDKIVLYEKDNSIYINGFKFETNEYKLEHN